MNKILQHESVNQFLGKLPIVKRLFFSVFGVVILVFLFVSLLSYDATDTAWSHIGGATETKNVGGLLGAWAADILRVFFGFGAWFFVVAIAYELANLWLARSLVAWVLRLFAYVFLLACISAIFAQIGAWWQVDKALAFGGVLGFEMLGGMVGVLGVPISMIFLALMTLIVSTLAFDIDWSLLWAKIKRKQSGQNADDVGKGGGNTSNRQADEFVISHVDLKSSVCQTQDHDGALKAFLVNSGLREKLLAKKQDSKPAKDFQMPLHNNHIEPDHQILDDKDERDESYLAGHDDVMDHLYDDQDRHQNDDQDDYQDSLGQQSTDNPVSDKVRIDNNGDVAFAGVDFVGLDNNFGNDDEICDDIAIDELPTSMASGTVRPKSHAMSTLEYRMSLSPVPELDILDPKPTKKVIYTQEELKQLSELLEIKLQEFNVKAEVISAMVGPVVTRFEVNLAAGIKASRVSKIAQDLARSMSMASLRVIPVIAGKPYIGIEVPNRKRQIVSLIELLDTQDYQDPNAGISMAIGTNISGKPVIADLAKAPHMLVAGTTGSGKSVLVNSFLMSMLLKYTPDELKLVLIDPKQLELANYADIPHLLTPVITDMTEATAALNWCVTEMERRYLLMSKLRVRNLTAFNQKIIDAKQAGEPILDPLWSASEHVSVTVPTLKPLSKIVVVADEFADMIMQLGKTAEEPIVRLAQKSRAAGIHLILATQRPVANVVTGLIKSNIPSRVALRVNSATDSRIIIEESGAENMLGHGDMMFLAPGAIETERVHGAYVKDDEVNRVTDAWRERGKPDYIDLSQSYTFDGEGSGDSGTGCDDEYFDLAVSHTLETRKVSISALQRKFSIGYNRAARIVDMMEERGIVSAADNNGKRQILM